MGKKFSVDLELEEFIPLIVVLLLVGVWAGHFFWPRTEVVAIEVERLVEVPVVEIVEVPVVVTETKVQIIEVPYILYQVNYTVITVPVITQETDIVEVPIYLEVNKVRDFEDMEELFAFIRADKTNEIEYNSKRFNCMDFAITVADNALKVGYRVIFLYSYNLETMKSHAVCMAYVRGDAQWMVWDPQTDEILWGWISRITDGVN